MNQRYFILIVMLYFVSSNVNAIAQGKTVSGIVANSRGNALPGVKVTVDGTTSQTVTDATGRYIISLPDGSGTLSFSLRGYETREVQIDSQTVVDVALDEEVKQHAEVVVTALNIERNTKTLQSSVTQISGDNFSKAREINIGAQLEGRVAGVNVTRVASGLAASSRVVIRGAKSFGGSNQPLYVIDGTPIDNSNFGQSGLWGGPDNGDGLNSISPDDIESITVLKGAASAALYGSRAANGVVLITTKSATARKGIGIELNSNLVAERVINYTDLQRSHGAGGYIGPTLATRVATKAALVDGSATGEPDWNTAFYQRWNSQGWGPRFDGSNVVQPDGVVRPYSYSGDNFHRFFRTGIQTSNSIALSGGNQNQNLRISYSNLSSRGVVPNSGFNRDNLTLSFISKLGKKLTVVGKGMYSKDRAKNRPMISDSPGNAVQAVYTVPVDQNITLYKQGPKNGAVPSGMVTPDGKAVGEELQATVNRWGQNPYWAAYQYINSDVRERVTASANLRYDLTDFLYATGQVGMDWYKKKRENLTPQGTGYRRAGSISETETRVREVNFQATIGYHERFGKIGVNGFVGGNRMRSSNETMGYGDAGYGINALFASSEISFNDFLFITATAREDLFLASIMQSQLLSPSIGGSFVFTDVIKRLPTLLSFGKIRVSYARVGNASPFVPYAVGNFDYFANASQPGFGVLPNPDLKASISSEAEFGLDVRFFQNRFGLDFTYYAQTTFNDIFNVSINPATGYTSTPVNMGNLQNRGIEVLFTGRPVKGSIAWDVGLNFARNASEVLSLVAGTNRIADEEPRTRTVRIQHIVGLPYGEITGIKQRTTPGGKLVYNSNGVPLTDGIYHNLGNGVPKFTGGLDNSVTYKSFSLGMLIDFKYGGKVYSGTNVRMTQWGYTMQTLQGRAGEDPLHVAGAIQTGVDGTGAPVYTDFAKTLTPGEAQNYWLFLGERAADRFVYDASFVKLRQLTLGYQVPKSMLPKMPFQTVTFSIVARNLATLYKNTPNIDPESSYTSSNAQGLDYFGMPPTRTFGINLNMTF